MHHAAKRRRTKVNVYAPRVDFAITAEECRVQQQRSLHEGGHLIQLSYNSVNSSSWKDEEGGGSHDTSKQPMHLLVDRYDARALMDELSLQQLCHRHMGASFNTDGVINKGSSSCLHRGELEEEGSREEIDQRNIERFGMLPPERQACTTTGKPGVEEKDGKAEQHHDESEDNKEINEEPFEPTEEQRSALPNDVVLPRTMRQHNIIELTAARVANNPQLEIFLKLKQSSNTSFSFINPADDLHPYYIHLKGKCSGENIASNEAESPDGEVKSGLDGLLAGYSSSNGDEDDTGNAIEAKDSLCAASITREQDSDVQKRKAE
jgi:hypothetical protein